MTDYQPPHRRRWPWVLLALACVALLVLTFYAVWSAGANRRLDREIARLKAAGEPIEWSDFAVKGVADADNAVIDLRAAAGSIDASRQQFQDYETLTAAIPLTDKERRLIAAVVADNAAAFAGVDLAVTRKGVDWKIPVKSPAIQILLPDLGQMRMLSTLIGSRALLEHEQGDDAKALRDVSHLLFIADAVDQQPLLISHLVASGIRALADDRLEQIAH